LVEFTTPEENFWHRRSSPDGAAHDLSRTDRMYQFNQHWQDREGLKSFQQHLVTILNGIS
jgi:hypothetical protein